MTWLVSLPQHTPHRHPPVYLWTGLQVWGVDTNQEPTNQLIGSIPSLPSM